jgi:hypothetical protein
MNITERFQSGEFIISAEIGPPKGIHIEPLLEEAKEYLGGMAAINVTDNQASVMRLGSMATCKALLDAGMTLGLLEAIVFHADVWPKEDWFAPRLARWVNEQLRPLAAGKPLLDENMYLLNLK